MLRKIAIGVGVVILAVVSFAIYPVGGGVVYWAAGLSLPCADQCQAPFVLGVTFKQGTSDRADTAPMIRCADNSPEVTVIGPAGLDPNHSGAVIGIMRTKEFGGVKTAPIIKCLAASPLILDAAYPN